MKQYLDLVKTVLEEGSLKLNRTGIDTISYFAYPFRHDLANGFPLLTTKKMSESLWKSLVHELLWFISGENHIRNLRKHTKIWDAWADEEGNVGPIYGVQWTRWKSDEIIAVEKKICHEDFDKEYQYPLFPLELQDEDIPLKLRSDHINAQGYVFRVIKPLFKDQQRGLVYKIQFVHTGYSPKYGIRQDVIHNGQIKDLYEPSVCNVGFLGEYDKTSCSVFSDIKKTWDHMLERCYNKNCKEYVFYGAKGVKVCKRWHCFSNFLKDVTKLPNWQEKVNKPKEYQLDKDYYCSSCYSPNTCVWLLKSDNIRYASASPVVAQNKYDERETFISQVEFLKKYSIPRSVIPRILNTDKQYRGWKLFNPDNSYTYRKSLPINQLENIINEIKQNPNNRRLVMSAWNPAQIYKMGLPPCHAFVVFNVQNGRLCLHMTQRSCDIGLGVCFNIASYALLMHVVAKATGLDPGILSIMFVDAHIYCAELDDNTLVNGIPRCEYDHVRVLKEQLTRDPFSLPQIEISGGPWNQHNFEDFKLINYQSHGPLKMRVAF